MTVFARYYIPYIDSPEPYRRQNVCTRKRCVYKTNYSGRHVFELTVTGKHGAKSTKQVEVVVPEIEAGMLTSTQLL